MRSKNEGKKAFLENSSFVPESAGYANTKYDIKSRKALFKSIRRFILSVVLVLAVIFAGSVLFVTIKTNYYLAKQTDEYNTRSGEIQTDLKSNLEAVNNRYISETIKTVFTQDDIYAFTYNLWSYGLYVNDMKITSTNTLTINPADKIYIKEICKPSILPDEFVKLGNLTRGDANDSLINHFSLKGKPYIIKTNKKGLVNTYTISGTVFKIGDKFNIVLSDQLARRLDFTRDVIKVIVKG